jgi:hypothetical protein
MSTRFLISALIFMVVNAVVFGVGIILVLTIPVLAGHAMILIPAVIFLAVLLSIPIAWFLAPRLRSRYQRAQAAAEARADSA